MRAIRQWDLADHRPTGFQLHGVRKGNLKDVIRGINEAKLSTLAACGDVCRNFMCCPAPIKSNPVRQQMQQMASTLADHFRPRSSAYYEIWLRDSQAEHSEKIHEATDSVEPIYGATYLPRKFKFGIALPEDNCVDIYTQDLGLLAVVEDNRIVGYNVLVGGGQGMTPAKKGTFRPLLEGWHSSLRNEPSRPARRSSRSSATLGIASTGSSPG